jgi:hypothetical protein
MSIFPIYATILRLIIATKDIGMQTYVPTVAGLPGKQLDTGNDKHS